MKEFILKMINERVSDLRKQRRFCNEHRFELESKSYDNIINELEDLRFNIEINVIDETIKEIKK